jgi:hypothetical protein
MILKSESALARSILVARQPHFFFVFNTALFLWWEREDSSFSDHGISLGAKIDRS